jgi:hypothetical protein
MRISRKLSLRIFCAFATLILCTKNAPQKFLLCLALGPQMVFLAITRKGYENYRALGHAAGSLWLCTDVLSENELVALRQSGIDVSVFNYKIESHEAGVLAGAVETIKEHHPGEQLWVEG